MIGNVNSILFWGGLAVVVLGGLWVFREKPGSKRKNIQPSGRHDTPPPAMDLNGET